MEDVERPATLDVACPACAKPVRLVERELVKNLRVFGVPLVGVEKGRRVFQCPRCEACLEPASATSARDRASPAERVREAPSPQLERARDEVRIWTQRVALAQRHGEAELAREARARLERAQREVARLTAAQSEQAPGAVAPSSGASPARVVREPGSSPGRENAAPSEGLLSALGSIVGIGVGSLEIRLDRQSFAPGETVRGTLVLALERPVDATRLVVGVEATQKVRTRRTDARGVAYDADETRSLYKFEHQVAGERRYEQRGTFAFELPLPADATRNRTEIPDALAKKLGAVGDLLALAANVADANRPPVTWQLFAFLEIPWRANVKSRVDIVVRGAG